MLVFQNNFSGTRISPTVTYVGIAIISLFSLGMCCVMGSFFSYHIMLICSGETTRERLTRNKKRDNIDDEVRSMEENPEGLPIVWPTDDSAMEGRTLFFWNRPASLLKLRDTAVY
jgi:hypothetical protein